MNTKNTENVNVRQYIAEDILNNEQIGFFDSFFRRYLCDFENDLIAELSQFSTEIELDIPSIINGAVHSQREILIPMAARSLLLEMYGLKTSDKLEGQNTHEQYLSFSKIIDTDEFHEQFAEKYPLLMDLIQNKIKTKVRLLKECVSNLCEDLDDIENKFGYRPEKLNKLISDGGDTHNDGRSVVAVTVNDNIQLFYKPHSLDGDVFFYDFVKEFSNNKNFSEKLAEFLSYSDHGWQKCAEYLEAETKEQITEYYKNIGRYVALFYVLGTEDMHNDNIIASGNTPKFIDLETVLSNHNTEWYPSDINLLSTVLNEIKTSTFTSMILPQNHEFAMFDIDLSALTGGMDPTASSKIGYYKLQHPFTSDICYEKTLSNIVPGKNLLRFNGEIVEPGNYTEAIIEGFEDTYFHILERRDDIRNWLSEKTKEKLRFRQVLRATYMYAKFQDASYHPKYLYDLTERERLFSLMSGKGSSSDLKNQVIDTEKKVMLNDDIPYFFTYIDSKNVYSPYKTEMIEIDNIYGSTIIETIFSRLDKLSKDDLRKQSLFIRTSLTNHPGHQIDSFETQDKFLAESFRKASLESDTKKKYLKMAESIALAINSQKIVFEENDSAALLELNINNSDNKQMLGLFKADLYNGLGCMLFIGLVAHECQNKELEHFMYQMDRGFDSLYPLEKYGDTYNILPLSTFSGLGSYLYVYSTLYNIYHAETFKKKIDFALNEILKTDLEKTEIVDVIDGIAGTLIPLCAIAQENKDERLLGFIENAANILIDKTLSGSINLAGFAHGYSGVISALSEVYKLTGNKALADSVRKIIEKEDTMFSAEHGNWLDARSDEGNYDMSYWCHGHVGIALSRLNTAENFSDIPDIVEKCHSDADIGIKTLLDIKDMHKMNHCLCHGFIGNIEILNSMIGKTKYTDEIREFIDTNMNNFIGHVNEKGFNYQYDSNIESLALMTGLSGIGYGLLRLANVNTPDVLLLKIK